jgi:hypothetical protein
MKLAVGYPVIPDDAVVEAFLDAVETHGEAIEEVYFALPGQASGRTPAADADMLSHALPHLRSLGLRLDLLFNANCYGPGAAGKQLADDICRRIDQAGRLGGIDVVTTTSPFIASVLRERFPHLELRASVNMRIGTVPAMEMVADLFDGFYAQRDHNRDPAHLRRLRNWCRANGKRLFGLVNSGCLAFCAGQTFHDNLVAHEADGAPGAATGGEILTCRRFLADPSHWPAILSATWIRPEDLHRYDGLFDLAKLATRLHSRPAIPIAAYARGRHRGNLLDLLEPGHGASIRETWLDSRAFPADWFERTTGCDRHCALCGYCSDVWRRLSAAVRQDESGETLVGRTICPATRIRRAGCPAYSRSGGRGGTEAPESACGGHGARHARPSRFCTPAIREGAVPPAPHDCRK